MTAFLNPPATGVIAAGALDGTEQVQIFPGTGGANAAPANVFATVQQIADLATLTSDNFQITALNTVGAGVVTAAGIAGGITSRGGGQTATPFSDTTATAALIIAQLPEGAPVGTSFYWTYENTTDAAATLTAGVGVTVSGNSVIPLGQWTMYLVTKTAAAAVTITSVISGPLSPLPPAKYTESSVQGTTVGVGGLTGAQICNLTLTGNTPGTIPVGPASAIIAAIPNAQIGLSYQLNVRNAGTATAQLSGLTNTTITGTSTINASVTRVFMVSIPSAGAVTLQNIGAMTG